MSQDDEAKNKKIQKIFDLILKEHEDLRKFVSGFAKPKICNCKICKGIREYYRRWPKMPDDTRNPTDAL